MINEYPLLLFIRHSLYSRGMGSIIGKKKESTVVKKKGNYFVFLLRAFRNRIFQFSNKYKYIFFFPDQGIRARFQGKNIHVIYDLFMALYSNESLSIESARPDMSHQPDRYHRNVAYDDFMIILSRVRSFFTLQNKREIMEIDAFIQYTRDHFPVRLHENDISKMRNELIQISKSILIKEKQYRRLLSRFNPEIIFIHTAHYGGYKIILSSIAKEMGICVAEFQHGYISDSHISYNFPIDIGYLNKIRQYFPDYLLTFGDFWGKDITIPGKVKSIGYPFLLHSVRVAKKKAVTGKSDKHDNKRVLFLSQKRIPQVFNNLIEEFLSVCGKKYTVILRPHPREIPDLIKNYPVLSEYKDNLELDTGEMYESIAGSDFVVGCYSTAVFEVLAFEKPLFIIKHPLSDLYIPNEIGYRVSNGNELLQGIQQVNTQYSFDHTYFFDENWKENFERFIGMCS